MFIINPKNIKNLRIYLASPKVANRLLQEHGIAPFCYMADEDGKVKAGFRITDELIDVLKRMKIGLGKE